jgi:hypothetical protein
MTTLGRTRETKKKAAKKDTDKAEEEDGSEWHRALGWGLHDEKDFGRVWGDPLHQVLKSSLSMPAITHHQKMLEKARTEGNPALATPPLDNFRVEYVSSEPGALKARIILDSKDKMHRIANDLRLKQLLQESTALNEVGPAVSKHMRKSGCLLPKYGIQVVFRRGVRPGLEANNLTAPGTAMTSPTDAPMSR